jgi:hypothetical protein
MEENNTYNLDKIIEKNYSINSLDLYLKNSLELRNFLKQFLMEYPNNMELGKKVRSLYMEVSDNIK